MALFHQLLFSAWRIGILDLSVAELTDMPPAQLSAATFAGFTDGALLREMAPGDPIGLRLRPQLPIIARADSERRDGILLEVADLFIDLELTDGRPWATFQVDLGLFVRPKVTGGQLAIDLEIEPRVSFLAAPLFPVDGERLGSLLETLLSGLPAALGDDTLNELVDLTQLDLFGIEFSQLLAQSSTYPNPWLALGLTLLPPAPTPAPTP